MFEQSPEKYIRKYITNPDEPDFETIEMRFGKKFAEAREKGIKTGDIMMDMVAEALPKSPLREVTITATLESPYGEILLLGRLDGFDEEKLIVSDDKTGKGKMLKEDFQKSVQLLHYATMIYLKYGKLPSEIWIHWATTENGYAENGYRFIRFTGETGSIKIEFTLKDILEYMARVTKVAVAIDKIMKEYEIKRKTD
jgi:hypothetical protein